MNEIKQTLQQDADALLKRLQQSRKNGTGVTLSVSDVGVLCEVLGGGGQWISVDDRLPEKPNKFVLVCTNSNYANQIVAQFIPKFTNSDGADDEFGDYCEEKDDWFLPEGWYANVAPVTDEYLSYFLDEQVTHWMPLPKEPSHD